MSSMSDCEHCKSISASCVSVSCMWAMEVLWQCSVMQAGQVRQAYI